MLKHLVRGTYPYKWTAIFDDGKRTHFGHQGYEDYTQHHDEERKKHYLQRHSKDLETKDPRRAGFLSYYILWNKPTLRESVKDYKRKFNL